MNVVDPNSILFNRLLKQGNNISRSRFRRGIGLFDNQTIDWLNECRVSLLKVGLGEEAVDLILEPAFKRPARDTLGAVVSLLAETLADTPWNSTSNNQHPITLPLPDFESISVKNRSCFVMMPFAKEFDAVYRNAILPALTQSACTSIRADEIVKFGQISTQIFSHIAESQFCVADITGQNPNVMYELGIAHALKKNTIILTCDLPEEVPFDVSHYRMFQYHSHPAEHLQILRADIVTAVASILQLNP